MWYRFVQSFFLSQLKSRSLWLFSFWLCWRSVHAKAPTITVKDVRWNVLSESEIASSRNTYNVNFIDFCFSIFSFSFNPMTILLCWEKKDKNFFVFTKYIPKYQIFENPICIFHCCCVALPFRVVVMKKALIKFALSNLLYHLERG